MEDDRKKCMMKIYVIYALRQIDSGWHLKAKEMA
jgi:hypothetical protein